MNTIVVIGGVAAGMSCAARLRRLDEKARIIVLEKGDDISIASCGLPYFVSGEIEQERSLRVQTPASIGASLNLDIRVGHEALSIDRERRTVRVRSSAGEEELSYDALLLAPGARGVELPIPGIGLPQVRTLRSIPDAVEVAGIAKNGGRAVVIGAGFIGLEAAEALALAGMEVALVEGTDHVLPPVEEELSALVLDELEELGLRVIESARVTGIEEAGQGARVLIEGLEPLEADLVLVAVGTRPRSELAEAAGLELQRGAIVVDECGRTCDPRIWAAGDAVLSRSATTGALRPIPLAGPASRAGRRIADDIVSVIGAEGAASPREAGTKAIAAPLGTAIVRVGRLQVAMTGANSRELSQAGVPFWTIHAHHNQHVAYFPGAQMMALIVHVGEDGAILGAQGIGRDGVDRRIDVLATAIRAGLKAEDLVDIDLAYSPPFGAPKDPVNMVGMVAENLNSGLLELCYPWQLEEMRRTHLVLDVRRPDEIERGPRVPGALGIAHTELRDRLDEVREAAGGRPVLVHCAAGVRSYLAHRVLAEAGFVSTSLSGGMNTLKAWAKRHPGTLEY